MKLDDRQKQHFVAHVNEKIGGFPPCAVCRKGKWQIDPTLYCVQEVPSPPEPVSSVQPLVVITCVNCGYTLLFNAVHAAGITQDDVSQEDEVRASVDGAGEGDTDD